MVPMGVSAPRMLRSAQQLHIGETQDSAFDALRRPE